jgi:hypothetical protein
MHIRVPGTGRPCVGYYVCINTAVGAAYRHIVLCISVTSLPVCAYEHRTWIQTGPTQTGRVLPPSIQVGTYASVTITIAITILLDLLLPLQYCISSHHVLVVGQSTV